MVLSLALCLKSLNQEQAAIELEKHVFKLIKSGHTTDLGGSHKTSEIFKLLKNNYL